MESDSVINGSPIQIVRVIGGRERNDGGHGHHRLHLDEETFSNVFDKYKHQRCLIVSIAGPLQSGKSFLMNWCKTYLDSCKLSSEWIEAKMVTGFSSKPSFKSETQGFYLWSEPFPIEIGQDTVNVFLMDCQGFDEGNSVEVMTFVGFSMLASSGVIYNSFEVDPSIFETLLPILNSLKEKPLKKMVLLVRDANDATNLQKFKHVEAKKSEEVFNLELTVNGTPVRLRNVFEQSILNSYVTLLPHPGGCVDEADYHGDCKKLRQIFLKKLRPVIEEIFSFGSRSTQMTGGEMVIEFTNIVNMFNQNNHVTEICIKEMSSKIASDCLIEKCVGDYRREIEKMLKPNLKWDELNTIHQVTSKSVLSECRFNTRVCVNLELLIGRIDDEYRKIKSEHEEGQQKTAERAVEEVMRKFTKSFYENMRESAQAGNVNQMDIFDDVTSELEGKAKKGYRDAVGQIEKDVIKKYKDILRTKLLSSKRELRREVQSEEEHTLNKLLHESVGIFNSSIEIDLNDDFVTDRELGEQSKMAEKAAVEFFRSRNVNFQAKSSEFRLKQLIEHEIAELKEKNDTKREEVSREIADKGEKIIRDVLEECNRAIDDEIVTNRDQLMQYFENSNKEKMKEIMSTLRTEKQRGLAMEKIRDGSTYVIQDLENKLATKVNEIEEKLEKLKAKAKHDYVVSMGDAVNSDRLLDTDEFRERHEQLRNGLQNELKQMASQSACHGWVKVVHDFEEVVEEEFRALKQMNELNIEALQSETENLVEMQVANYDIKLKEELKILTEKQMRDLHDLTLITLQKELNKQMKQLPTSLKKSISEKFGHRVEKSYKDALGAWQLYQDVRIGKMKTALDNAKKFYENEMDTYLKNSDYHQPRQLVRFHEATIDNALQRYKNCPEAAEDMEEEFINQLHQLYEILKVKNRLNYPQNTAIGIDLGTTNCCVCVVQGGKVITVKNNGYTTTPSYMWLDKDSDYEKVGLEPKSESYIYPKNTIFDAKRLIGRRFDDEDIQRDIRIWPFDVVDIASVPHVKVIHNKAELLLRPEEVSARILRELKKSAELMLGVEVTDAIITVPAYFGNNQREMTKDAGEAAGLNVLRIIDEPVAAAMAFRLNTKIATKTTAMVYDFGGGTLDVAILEISQSKIDIKAKAGDNHLGGEDIDNNMFDACIDHLKADTGVDLRDDHATRQRLLRVCEEHKKHLSCNKSSNIRVNNIIPNQNFVLNMTRKEFNIINEKIYKRAMIPVLKCLEQAKMEKSEIDEIVLVGGSTRIPKIQKILKKFFGKQLNKSLEGDEVVAQGAAIQAIITKGDESAEFDDVFKSIAVKNVTPYNIGIKVVTGELSVVIKKTVNTPVEERRVFTTVNDYQESVRFEIYEGDNLDNATENNILGMFDLDNLPPDLKGRLELDVIMSINDEGILKVTATCTRNGCTNEIVINGGTGRMAEERIRQLKNK